MQNFPPLKCLCLQSGTCNNNNKLQAFQLIVLARYLLGVRNPSPVSQHALGNILWMITAHHTEWNIADTDMLHSAAVL